VRAPGGSSFCSCLRSGLCWRPAGCAAAGPPGRGPPCAEAPVTASAQENTPRLRATFTQGRSPSAQPNEALALCICSGTEVASDGTTQSPPCRSSISTRKDSAPHAIEAGGYAGKRPQSVDDIRPSSQGKRRSAACVRTGAPGPACALAAAACCCCRSCSKSKSKSSSSIACAATGAARRSRWPRGPLARGPLAGRPPRLCLATNLHQSGVSWQTFLG